MWPSLFGMCRRCSLLSLFGTGRAALWVNHIINDADTAQTVFYEVCGRGIRALVHQVISSASYNLQGLVLEFEYTH